MYPLKRKHTSRISRKLLVESRPVVLTEITFAFLLFPVFTVKTGSFFPLTLIAFSSAMLHLHMT